MNYRVGVSPLNGVMCYGYRLVKAEGFKNAFLKLILIKNNIEPEMTVRISKKVLEGTVINISGADVNFLLEKAPLMVITNDSKKLMEVINFVLDYTPEIFEESNKMEFNSFEEPQNHGRCNLVSNYGNWVGGQGSSLYDVTLENDYLIIHTYNGDPRSIVQSRFTLAELLAIKDSISNQTPLMSIEMYLLKDTSYNHNQLITLRELIEIFLKSKQGSSWN